MKVGRLCATTTTPGGVSPENGSVSLFVKATQRSAKSLGYLLAEQVSFPKIPSGLDSSSSRRKGSKFSADLHEANAPLVRCYAPWGSLFARKFSLLWRLGNSLRKQLNFLPKAGAPRSSRARKRRISLYLPVEQGNKRAETGSPMTASSASN